MVDITVPNTTIDRLHAILSGFGNVDKKVLKPALERGLSAGRVTFNKQIMTVYSVSSETISRYSLLKYKKVEMNNGELIGSIEYSGTPVPLIKFNVTPQEPTYGKTPVLAAEKIGEGPTEFVRAFTAQMPNGHIGVYEREGNPNYPIKQLYGSSVPRMAENAVVIKTVEDRVNEVINKRMEHELNRLLNGGG